MEDVAANVALPAIEQVAYKQTGKGGPAAMYTLCVGLSAAVFAVEVLPATFSAVVATDPADRARHASAAAAAAAMLGPAIWLGMAAAAYDPISGAITPTESGSLADTVSWAAGAI